MRLLQLLAPVAGLVAVANAWGSIVWTTEVVTSYTTYCPSPTTFAYKNTTYTVTSPTTITLSCPCTISKYTPPPVTTTAPTFSASVVFPNSTTVITLPPTTELAGTTVITSNVPTGPTTTPAVVTAAAGKVGSGVGALGLIAGMAALVL